MPTTAANIVLAVACALVDGDGRVLVAQRPPAKSPKSDPMAGLWAFPGGKIAPHETPEAALMRQLKDALSIDVTAACLAPLGFASHGGDDFHLLMPLYVCRKWDGQVRPCKAQAVKWLRPRDLFHLDMPPADKSLIAALRDAL